MLRDRNEGVSMIDFLIIGLAVGGVTGFYIGVIAGTYWFLKDHGLLPHQRRRVF